MAIKSNEAIRLEVPNREAEGLDSCHERDERPDEAAGSSQNELVASAANTRFLTVEPIDLPLPLSGVFRDFD